MEGGLQKVFCVFLFISVFFEGVGRWGWDGDQINFSYLAYNRELIDTVVVHETRPKFDRLLGVGKRNLQIFD